MAPHSFLQVLLVALAALTGAQVAPPSARLTGTVLTTDEPPQPVRRAIVSIYGGDRAIGHHTITDDEGRFDLAGLPAGRYSVSASRPAFVTIAYGARRPGWPGTPIALASGEQQNIRLQLARGSAITGVVRDTDGQPITNLAVWLEPARGVRGAGFSQRIINTDDRGAYRFFGLAAGSYVVSARPTKTGRDTIEVPTDADVDAALKELQGRRLSGPPMAKSQVVSFSHVSDFVTVFHPSAFAEDEAALVTIGVGDERVDIDITVRLMPLAVVSGLVLPADRIVLTDVQLTLSLATTRRNVQPARAMVQSDGTFRFPAVTPGRYLLAARAMSPDLLRASLGTPSADRAPAASRSCLFGAEEIVMSGSDLTGVAIALRPCLKISGRVATPDNAGSTLRALGGVRITLEPNYSTGAPGFVPARIPVVTDPDGLFLLGEFSDLLPGSYHLRAVWPGAEPGRGWWLQAATADGQDILDQPLNLRADSSETTNVLFNFTDRHTSLSGTLEGAANRPAVDFTVIAFPAKREWWKEPFRRVLASRPGTDGGYTIWDLPPGEYYIAALTEVAPDEWRDAVFLEQIVSAAIQVTILPGEQKVQHLRIAR